MKTTKIITIFCSLNKIKNIYYYKKKFYDVLILFIITFSQLTWLYLHCFFLLFISIDISGEKWRWPSKWNIISCNQRVQLIHIFDFFFFYWNTSKKKLVKKIFPQILYSKKHFPICYTCIRDKFFYWVATWPKMRSGPAKTVT